MTCLLHLGHDPDAVPLLDQLRHGGLRLAVLLSICVICPFHVGKGHLAELRVLSGLHLGYIDISAYRLLMHKRLCASDVVHTRIADLLGRHSGITIQGHYAQSL